MVWTTSTILALLIGIFGGVGVSTAGYVIKSKSTSSKANKLLENAKRKQINIEEIHWQK